MKVKYECFRRKELEKLGHSPIFEPFREGYSRNKVIVYGKKESDGSIPLFRLKFGSASRIGSYHLLHCRNFIRFAFLKNSSASLICSSTPVRRTSSSISNLG